MFGPTSLASLGSVFFAFAGWQLATLLRREFGAEGGSAYRAVLVVSFAVVATLYVLVVVALALTPAETGAESTLSLAPLAAFVAGQPVTVPVYAVGSLLMISSLFANILGYGNLVGQTLAQVRPSAKSGALTAAVVLSVVCLATSCMEHPAQALFQIAGSSFLLVYVIACAALITRTRQTGQRLIAAIAVLFGSTVLTSLLDELLVPVGVGLLTHSLVAASNASRHA